LSTLRQADRLVVLDRGRIVEVGRHDQLLAQNGIYSQLYQAQQRGEEPAPSQSEWVEEGSGEIA